jgi:pimeloyl-ACP methyl ester carboxylesterase
MNCKATKCVGQIVVAACAATVALAALNKRIAGGAGTLGPAIDGGQESYGWDGERVAYTHAGAGRPMLLLHSHNAAASSHEMRRAFAAFQDEFHVFAPDLPGYGRSERRDRPYTAQTYARFINDFLDDVVGGPAVVIASSVAAAQALLAAAEDAGRISHLVLISPTGLSVKSIEPPPVAELMGCALRVPIWGKALFNAIVSRRGLRHFEESQVYENPWNVTHALIEYSWRTSHQPNAIFAPASFLSGGLWADARDAYRHAARPILAVWGESDKINPYADSAPLLGANPGARVSVITNAGAVPHDEQPGEFAAVVRQFLSQTGGG